MSEKPDAFVSRCSCPALLIAGRIDARKLQLRPVVVAICVGLVVSAASVEVISRLRLPDRNRTIAARRWK